MAFADKDTYFLKDGARRYRLAPVDALQRGGA